MITIRNEMPTDYKKVEVITRKAFYNLYRPGCDEHYLVHKMRTHEDFIPALDFVIEMDGEIIGNIMYTKAKLTNETGKEKEILTFGPVSILPEYQRKGYGKRLLNHSFKKAVELGYDTIVIFGSPSNYVTSGFKSCKKFNVCIEGEKYPAAMMVKALKENPLEEGLWMYSDSPVMHIDEKEADLFDDGLEKMEKKYKPIQEEFAILSRAFIE